MVKHLIRLFLFSLAAVLICFLSGCNIDLLGLFAANDLDERLKERNNLLFLNSEGWTSLTLGDSYSFVVLSDTHIEDGDAFGLEKLAGVTNSNKEIKFAVMLGDITQNGAAKDIDKFIEIAKSLGVPCYPVAGNHDIYFDNWSVWKNKIGSTNYRINADTASLFVLDSANSFYGKDQLDWLEREIKTAGGRVFVFSHSPLFVKGPGDMQQITDTRERARIISILRNRCDIMFMGHLHKLIENEAGNVKYIAIESFVEDKIYYIVSVTSGGVSYRKENL